MMPPNWNAVHGPVFANTVCHGVGVLVFGLLAALFVSDYRRSRGSHHLLPAVASGLAAVWNLGSLVNLVQGGPADGWFAATAVASYCALSFLPALLLRIAVGEEYRAITLCGYGVSLAGAGLHAVDTVTGSAGFHRAGLIAVTGGFSALTLTWLASEFRRRGPRGAPAGRLAASMAVLLLSLSFIHLGAEAGRSPWLTEMLLHHVAIPLALFVLLQDYRFLMLDGFVRVLTSMGFAGLAVYGAWWLTASTGLLEKSAGRPAWQALLGLTACLLLAAFAASRDRLQEWLTRAVFGRRHLEGFLEQLRQPGVEACNEEAYLAACAERIAGFMDASRCEIGRHEARPEWVSAAAPIPLPSGEPRRLLLGRRRGGRRYLSEDFRVLGRIAAVLAGEIARHRSLEMQSLAKEAELRALQAQINPHFLFNALNTLYGTIRRDNAEARRLVLDLSDVLRYALRAEECYIALEEELRIVEAYLEIERLRLGSRLETAVTADPAALATRVPALSIQPLVENAVKHGVARQSSRGYVRLSARRRGGHIEVEVRNSGDFAPSSEAGSGSGVGLHNVRRRVALCYGAAGELRLSSTGGETTATLTIPLDPPAQAVGGGTQPARG